MSTPAKKVPSMAKPKARETAIINKGAAAPDARARIQTSVYLTRDVLDRVEIARKSNEVVQLDRNQWMRAAILEKLIKDGF